jgi:hypothetical protein
MFLFFKLYYIFVCLFVAYSRLSNFSAILLRTLLKFKAHAKEIMICIDSTYNKAKIDFTNCNVNWALRIFTFPDGPQ